MAPPGPATRLLPPLVLALAGVARGTFTVAAWPRVAVVAFGGAVTVNCSRTPCPGGDTDDVTLGLETPLGATPGPGGRLWQSFRLENVSRWEPGGVTCAGSCGDSRDRDSVEVVVYQPPQRVTLDPVAPVAVGDSVTLRCHVLGVAPLRNLTVTLRRGAETLRTATFGDGDSGDNGGGSASVAVSHLLTVTRGDHGQDVTCHAELSLRPHGPLFARAAAPVTLSVFALPDPPQLLSPSILEAGTVTNVTCLVTGAFPAGDVGVTAALDREPLDVTVRVTGDTVAGDAAVAPGRTGSRELSCTAKVATVTRTARRWLRVYSFPEPTLELSPPTAPEGTEVTLTCQAGDTETPPVMLRDVTGVTLAQGHQTGVTKMPPPMALRVGDVTGVTPARGHQADVTNVTLTKGRQAGVTSVTQADVTEPPLMALRRVRDVTEVPPPMTLRVGDVTNVTLAEGHQVDVTEVPPLTALQRVQDVTDVTEMPPPGLLQVGDVTNVTLAQGHQADVTKMPPPMALRRVQDVTDVTKMPPPMTLRVRDVTDVTEVPPPMTLRVRDVTDVTEVPPPMTLRVGDVTNVTLAEGQRARLQLRVVARRDQQRFWCRATIQVGDKEVTKEVTAQLDVLYPPEIPSSTCPGSRTWLRGSVASLSCRATGNPVPIVTCHRRRVTGATAGATAGVVTRATTRATPEATTEVTTGATTRATAKVVTGATTEATTDVTTRATTDVTTRATPEATTEVTTGATTQATARVVTRATTGATTEVTTEPLLVTRDRAGTYVCKATNALGTRSRKVTVRVEYPPSLSESGCPSRRVWLEGQRRQLECHGDGDPPPRTRCHRHGGTRDGDIGDGDTLHGDIHDGGIQHGDVHDSDIHDGDIGDGGTHHGGIHDGGTHHGDIHDGGTHHGDVRDGDTQRGGTRHGDIRNGGTRDGDIRGGGGTHDGDIHDSGTHRGDIHGTQRGGISGGGTHDGGTHRGDTHSATHNGGTHHSDTHDSDTHHGDTHNGGTRNVTKPRGVTRGGGHVVTHHRGDTQQSDTHHGDTHSGGTHVVTQHSDTHHGDTHHGDTHSGDTHDATQPGVTHPGGVTRGGGRVVTRADGGRYVCRATNRHGVALRSVIVTVEAPPRLSERGCPERRRWLEGTPARLSCAASGNPRPRVTCDRLGDKGHPRDVTGPGDHPGDVIGVGDNNPSDVIGMRDDWDHPSDVIGRSDKSHPSDVIGMGESHPSDVIGRRDKSHPGDVIGMGETHPSDVIGMGDKSHPDDVTRQGVHLHDVTRTGDKSHPGDVIGMRDKSHLSDVIGTGDSHPSDVTLPGDPQGHPWVSPNVTRGDAGLYRCRATNAHGSAVRNVTVTVEYPPSAVTLRVLPSATVPRGVTVTVTCGSRGVPGVTFAWSHPGAANLRLSRDNSSVTVTGVTAANRGLYTCTASNRHGHSTGSVTVTVDESWLVALVALGTLGSVTVLALAVAGGFYLKSTACKKGEYNVRDAEGSSEAACLHRGDTGDDIFGIQLTQT